MKLFIREINGDFNYEVWSTEEVLRSTLRRVKEDGGYWTEDRNKRQVFIPWHRVEYAMLEKDEIDG